MSGSRDGWSGVAAPRANRYNYGSCDFSGGYAAAVTIANVQAGLIKITASGVFSWSIPNPPGSQWNGMYIYAGATLYYSAGIYYPLTAGTIGHSTSFLVALPAAATIQVGAAPSHTNAGTQQLTNVFLIIEPLGGADV